MGAEWLVLRSCALGVRHARPIIVVELEPDSPVLVPDIRGQATASVASSETTSLAVFE